VAHQQLLQFYTTLKSKGKCTPPELLKQLMLLHSYILVKTLICINDHKYVIMKTLVNIKMSTKSNKIVAQFTN
jgi:hypothetical protein